MFAIMDVFVFGSNLAGRHGKGAAVEARVKYGAVFGVGEGRTGNAYAIPTKDERLRPRTLLDVSESVRQFLQYAREHQECRFVVTRVGCGLAGFDPKDIAPLFSDAPANCVMPEW